MRELRGEIEALQKQLENAKPTDKRAAAGVVDYLRRRGVQVRAVPMTAATKTEAFQALRAQLNLGGLELYEEPQLLAELRRLRTRYAAGRAAVENPRVGGSHGDMAQALALASWEASRYGGGLGSNTDPGDSAGLREPDDPFCGIKPGMSL